MAWLRRIFRTFRREAHQQELEEELQFHLAMRVERNREQGVAPEEAQRNARLRFGNPAVLLERLNEIDVWLLPKSLYEDFRFGCRQLWRRPGFAITAICTLALGIGLNTAIFSVAFAVLLKPLPWPGADRLVAINERVPKFGTMNDSWPDYLDWKAQNHVFSEMAVLQPWEFHVTMAGMEQPISGASVDDSFFPLFGANLALGRTFTSTESTAGAAPSAIVSYAFWQHRLGGEAGALGRSIQVDGQSATVVGVLSPDFSIPYGAFQILLPLGIKANTSQLANRANRPGLKVVARLRPDISIAQARTEMNTIMDRLGRQYPDSNKDESAVITPLMDQFVGRAREIMLLLLGASGMILLLACANLANMCLARAAARQREFSLRASLGAGRWRLLRQALVEDLPIALLGGASGVGLAALMMKPAIRRYPHQLFRLQDAQLNLTVLLFAAGIALASWLAFAIVPALVVSHRKAVYSSIRTSGISSLGGSRLRSSLLAFEIAIALVVTISTGLLLRSLESVAHIDPGFRPDHLLVLEGMHADGGGSVQANTMFYDRLLERLRQLPGVRKASAVMELPLRGAFWTSPYVPDGRPEPPNTQQPWTKINFATPGYFQTVGMRLLSGRFLDKADDSMFVVVINETMARSLAERDPIGRQIYVSYAPHPAMRIIGVVADSKQFGLEQNNIPEVFIPAAQSPVAGMDVVLRTANEPSSIAGAAAATAHDMAETQPAPRAITMEALLGSQLGDRKFVGFLFSLFDCLAVILAVIGVSGVISYTIQQRTREIGVRMALGAKKRDVVRMIVLNQGGRPAVVGTIVGLASAAGVTRLLSHQLYHVSPSDPATFASAAVVLVGATLVASFVPARKAAEIDPAVTLRCE